MRQSNLRLNANKTELLLVKKKTSEQSENINTIDGNTFLLEEVTHNSGTLPDLQLLETMVNPIC